MSYQDLVGSTQTGSAVESRTRLACAATIVVPIQPQPVTAKPAAPSPDFAQIMADHEARTMVLDALPGDRLVREAKPDELPAAVVRRIRRVLDDKGPTALTADERAVQVYDLMIGEVFNGGFHQFFFNSSGDDAIALRAAIVRIGPPELLPIFDCALEAFPGSKPSPDREVRSNQLARWGERQFELFETLDTAFYAMSAIPSAVERFVSANASQFPSVARPITR